MTKHKRAEGQQKKNEEDSWEWFSSPNFVNELNLFVLLILSQQNPVRHDMV